MIIDDNFESYLVLFQDIDGPQPFGAVNSLFYSSDSLHISKLSRIHSAGDISQKIIKNDLRINRVIHRWSFTKSEKKNNLQTV